MIRIAWRNLWRHSGRTWITIIAIALTYSLYLLTSCIQEYTYEEMQKAAAKAAGGVVLVQGAGFQDSQMNDVLIEEGAAAVEKLRVTEGIEKVAPRVIINGLLSTSSSSSPTRLQGVDPLVEVEFQDMRKYVTRGTFLESNEESPIVLGSEIVKELEVDLGDRVILTATRPDGEMQRALFHLSGVLSTGSKMTDSGLAFTTVPAARKALSLENELTQIGLLGGPKPETVQERARAALPSAEGVEVLTWAEAMPEIIGFIEMDRAWGDVFGIVLFIVVLFAIMNTFLMAVMERIRELGMLRALGLTPGRVAALVLFETLFLTLVAVAIGLAVGYAGHLALDHWGLNMMTLYGLDTSTMDMGGISLTDPMIYSTLNPSRWFSITLSVIFMVLLSAAYPAYKASRLQPAQAMRFYE